MADTTNTGNLMTAVAAFTPDPFGGEFMQGVATGTADGTGAGTILLGFIFDPGFLWLPLWMNVQTSGSAAQASRLVLTNRGLSQRLSETFASNINGLSANWRVEPQPMDPLLGNLWTYQTPSVGVIVHTITVAGMRWPRNVGLNQVVAFFSGPRY